MSGPLEDKQQKRGENVENIKFSLVTLLNFMFSTHSPLFCCLSTRVPNVSHPSLSFFLHFLHSWPTVRHASFPQKPVVKLEIMISLLFFKLIYLI